MRERYCENVSSDIRWRFEGNLAIGEHGDSFRIVGWSQGFPSTEQVQDSIEWHVSRALFNIQRRRDQ